jgi:Ca2+-dependent lipid-binding protein
MLGIVTTPPDGGTAGNHNKSFKKKNAASAVDMIPARFIKTTSVKNNTLNPVWNEKFRLYVVQVLVVMSCIGLAIV